MTHNKLRLTVAHNNQTDLLPALSKLDAVESVYGKMGGDLVGGGRSSYMLADLTFKQLKELIDQAHSYNKKFIYLLNSPCLSNKETTRKFNNELFAFIGTLVDMGVDGFVIAMPYILDLVKKHFPKVTVSVSTFAIINSITKAKIWEDKGADRIIIQQDQNRDFKLLDKIRRAVSCELELFANNLCMDQCPYPPFHAAFNAHSSATKELTRGFALDFCAYNCAQRRLQHPVEFLRGRFIRPEDLHVYEEIGIDVFKLADRMKSTRWLTNVATAYNNRRYDGNLVELIGYPLFRGEGEEGVVGDPIKWMMRPDFIHMDMLKLVRQMGQAKDMVFIDNTKLDGFVDYFKKHDCRTAICDEECTHCQKYTDRAVTLDAENVAQRLAVYQEAVDMLVDRRAFAAEPLMKQFMIKTVGKAVMMLKKKKQAKTVKTGRSGSTV
ncbi:MAG: U32 family peptidase [Deltaproteobacteria bacterium]|nr:U32 family peptidase [Deltaproteobacteria bacterium]